MIYKVREKEIFNMAISNRVTNLRDFRFAKFIYEV